MISYDKFKRYIERIRREWDYIDDCEKVGFNIYQYTYGIDCTVELLEYIFNDKERWLSQWVFETNFGRDDELKTTINKNATPIRTIKEIYDFLVSNNSL